MFQCSFHIAAPRMCLDSLTWWKPKKSRFCLHSTLPCETHWLPMIWIRQQESPTEKLDTGSSRCRVSFWTSQVGREMLSGGTVLEVVVITWMEADCLGLLQVRWVAGVKLCVRDEWDPLLHRRSTQGSSTTWKTHWKRYIFIVIRKVALMNVLVCYMYRIYSPGSHIFGSKKLCKSQGSHL